MVIVMVGWRGFNEGVREVVRGMMGSISCAAPAAITSDVHVKRRPKTVHGLRGTSHVMRHTSSPPIRRSSSSKESPKSSSTISAR